MERIQKANHNRKLSDEQVREAHTKHVKDFIPIVTLAKEYGLTRRNLRLRFITLNLPYKRYRVATQTNHKFFDTIDTELKAYMLGFIIGDGNIGTYEPTLNIQIQDRDRYILEVFRDMLAPNVTLLDTLPRTEKHMGLSKLSVYSAHLIEQLGLQGVIRNKSVKPFTVDKVPQEYWRHLIRGFFDADGCVHKRKYGRTVFIVGSCKPFMDQIYAYFIRIGINAKLGKITRPGRAILYRVTVMAIKDVTVLYHLFYDNSTHFLLRKKKTFETVIIPS